MNTSIALIGNPNCGKTSVFNALTGAWQRIGNWPGVTVEQKKGICKVDGQHIEVVDMPGIYSLTIDDLEQAIDERIARDYIRSQRATVYVNVIDASNLERNLYLTAQLIEMQLPLIVAVNMLDVAKRKGIQVDFDALQKKLGCPVIGLQARQRKGINLLRAELIKPPKELKSQLNYPLVIAEAISSLLKSLNHIKTGKSSNVVFAMRLLENDSLALAECNQSLLEQVQLLQKSIQCETGEEADILIADARYQWIKDCVAYTCQRTTRSKHSWTTLIDNIVLHRWLGLPIFFLMMYLMFVFAINIGGIFQDFFTLGSDAIFVHALSQWLVQHHSPAWLITLISYGMGKGISTTLSFIPVLGAMYLFLALLEDSGYMARAAFVMDRAMQWLGLPGKSFVPLLVGFGCNVPAVMAARTLAQPRERIITVLMTPFMSCSARLAIYTVFVSAFFPVGGHNIVFLLYLTGILVAISTALLLRYTWLKGKTSPLIMELPVYHLPSWRSLGLHAWHRLKSFIIRAGKLIVPLCMLLSLLNTLTFPISLSPTRNDKQSLLAVLGHSVTPLFAPMGLQGDNWPATVGLLTGIMAKEVVIGSLNTLYTQAGHLQALSSIEPNPHNNLKSNLQAAWQSISINLQQIRYAFRNPLMANVKQQEASSGVFGQMVQRFDGKIGAFAYLIFVLLYLPCISTVAAMSRELNKKWAVFAITWSTGIAYTVATGFYQAATFNRHPLSSSIWLIGIVLSYIVIIGYLRYLSRVRN